MKVNDVEKYLDRVMEWRKSTRNEQEDDSACYCCKQCEVIQQIITIDLDTEVSGIKKQRVWQALEPVFLPRVQCRVAPRILPACGYILPTPIQLNHSLTTNS